MKRSREVESNEDEAKIREEASAPYSSSDDEEEEEAIFEGSSAPRLPKTMHEKATKKRVIVVLQKAALITVKSKQGYELLNCDEHLHLHKKLKKDPAESRPDILHQTLMTLLDSPLNKAGLLQVYIQTSNNVLIEVNPQVRIPRTFKRFAGLMVQLLHKLRIRSSDGSETLLKVIKGPITRHLPPGCRKFGTSVTGKLIDPHDLVPTLPQDAPIVFAIGSHAHGPADVDWSETSFSFSQYALSASVATGRLLNAFERHWGIL